MAEVRQNDQTDFWKSFGKIGIGQCKKKFIPMEVVLDNGDISTNVCDVLSKWRDAFSELLNPATESDQRTPLLPDVNISDTILDSHISILEVKHAIEQAKKERHLVSILYQLTF